MQNLVVKHSSGESYKVLLPRETIPQLNLTPESFWNEGTARQFISNLIVSNDYWRDIVNQCNSSMSCLAPDDIEKQVSSLMMHDKIKFYPVKIMDIVDHPPEKRALKLNNVLYRFEPSSSLLFNNVSETKKFKNIDEANEFLSEISNNEEKLNIIAHELNIQLPATASVSKSEIADAISQELVSGSIVIIVDKTSSSPPTTKETLNKSDIGSRTTGLGAGSSVTSETKAEDKEHLCTLNKMTLSCKHGRSVTLDPAKAIDPKTGNAKAVYLSVTSASKSSPQKDHEVLTAKIDITDKCGSHVKAPYSISSDSVQLVNENFGNVIKFYSPGEELNLTTEFYKYIWLPSIKPQSYRVYPPSFCNMSKFDGKAKSIKVNVYPDIKWDIGLDIGFGQIKASDSSPDDKKAAANNVIERKIEQEVFSISGKAKCTHGHDTIEYVSKFNNKFDAIKNEITGQNALLSKIFGKFQEGDNHSVTLDLPKLSFNGTSSIAENNGTPDVNIRWDYNVKAAPLIGIEAKVDVLPMLLKSSGWGTLFLPLLSELKEKYANPDGSVGVQLEASIVLSIAGKVSFNVNFSDSSFVNDEKSELRSLKFDVPFKCTGELKGSGHLLVFAVELGVTAELSSGFAYEMFMGADINGIYRSSILHFHGLIFEIKAYIAGKRRAPGKKKQNTGPGKKNSQIMNDIKRQKSYDNKWTWIEKRQVEFNKEYIIQSAS